MNALLAWLLNLKQIRLGVDPVSLRLTTPPEPWILASGLIMAIAVVALCYARESVRGWTRVFLGLCRLGAVLVIMWLFSKPALVVSRNRIYPSVVAVALDRSASMSLSERSAVDPSHREKRWDVAVQSLRGSDGLLAKLAARQQVALYAFADKPRLLATIAAPADVDQSLDALQAISPDGTATDLADSVRDVLETTRGNRLATVVLVTDGRQTVPAALEPAIAEAQNRQVALSSIAVGAPRTRRDVQVSSVWTDGDVFVNDFAVVHVRLAAEGYGEIVPTTLELRDADSGTLLGLRRAEINTSSTGDVDIGYRPSRPGRQRLRVSVLPRDDEDDADNNTAITSLNVHDEKIRVLYVESEPRFEYRFLKNSLIREPTFESSILLLSAARDFPQDGTHPIRRFPATAEELAAYHVVLLGDVDPRGDWISPAQVQLLIDFVSTRGGGIGFLAGELAMPSRLRNTPLEKLLPIRIDPSSTGRAPEILSDAFSPRLTALGRRHPLSRLAIDSESVAAVGQPDDLFASLPGWYWYARVAGPMPGAEVLMEHPSASTADGAMPLVVLGRFGAGRTYYQGSDDTWRWRQRSGEGYYDAWWVKVVRLLGGRARLGPQQRWRLEPEHRDNRPGEPVRLLLSATESATTSGRAEISVRITDSRGDLVDTVTAQRLDAAGTTYAGAFSPARSDRYLATADVSAESPGHPPVTAEFDVTASAEERRQTSTDHDLLRMLAFRTGGRCVSPREAADLAAEIPDRSVPVPDDIVEPIWDTPMTLLMFAIPITLEWIVRKLRGLA